jgi:hypothetical protein
MNRIILLLLISLPTLEGWSQTPSETINFLNNRTFDWACEPYAQGTTEKRLNFSLLPNGKLQIKCLMPSYYGKMVTNTTIDLNMVKSVYWNETDKKCTGIKIETYPNGFKVKIEMPNKPSTYIDGASINWRYDSIRLKYLSQTEERSKRIIKALEFLAVYYGADLKAPPF